MTDEEMLKSLNLIEKDLVTGKEGLTFTAIIPLEENTEISNNIKQLKELKIVERISSDRKGYWKIIK